MYQQTNDTVKPNNLSTTPFMYKTKLIDSSFVPKLPSLPPVVMTVIVHTSASQPIDSRRATVNNLSGSGVSNERIKQFAIKSFCAIYGVHARSPTAKNKPSWTENFKINGPIDMKISKVERLANQVTEKLNMSSYSNGEDIIKA